MYGHKLCSSKLSKSCCMCLLICFIGQYLLSPWLGAWRYHAVTWTNFDAYSVEFSEMHRRAYQSHQTLKLAFIFSKMSLKLHRGQWFCWYWHHTGTHRAGESLMLVREQYAWEIDIIYYSYMTKHFWYKSCRCVSSNGILTGDWRKRPQQRLSIDDPRYCLYRNIYCDIIGILLKKQ